MLLRFNCDKTPSYLAASKAARGATVQRIALLRRAEVGLAQVRRALAEKVEVIVEAILRMRRV